MHFAFIFGSELQQENLAKGLQVIIQDQHVIILAKGSAGYQGGKPYIHTNRMQLYIVKYQISVLFEQIFWGY